MFFGDILKVASRLPPQIRFSLGSQIIRSALSIVLNIAEGSGRGTDKELNHFFNIAIGSLNETVAGLDAAHRNSYLSKDKFDAIVTKLESMSRQLGGFKRTL